MIKADGSGTLKALTTDTSADDLDPNWSSNGQKIAFTATRGTNGDDEIYYMNVGRDQNNVPEVTGGPYALMNDTQDQYFVAWSPDATKIVFVSEMEGGDKDIFTKLASLSAAWTNITSSNEQADITLV